MLLRMCDHSYQRSQLLERRLIGCQEARPPVARELQWNQSRRWKKDIESGAIGVKSHGAVGEIRSGQNGRARCQDLAFHWETWSRDLHAARLFAAAFQA
jgi:hypothetical protein